MSAGRGTTAGRAACCIAPALWVDQFGGLLINWLTLVSLDRMGLDYLIANLVGAGIAAVWNFSLNHALTWRR